MYVYLSICLVVPKYLENYPTYRNEKKTKKFKILTERYPAEKRIDRRFNKLFLVKFVLKSDVLRLDSRSGSTFLT